MDEEHKIRTIDQFNNWCDHCQLFAVQFYIWNTEATQLETIIAEALNTLPGKVGKRLGKCNTNQLWSATTLRPKRYCHSA
jgi:hypothetical protein